MPPSEFTPSMSVTSVVPVTVTNCIVEALTEVPPTDISTPGAPAPDAPEKSHEVDEPSLYSLDASIAIFNSPAVRVLRLMTCRLRGRLARPDNRYCEVKVVLYRNAARRQDDDDGMVMYRVLS